MVPGSGMGTICTIAGPTKAVAPSPIPYSMIRSYCPFSDGVRRTWTSKTLGASGGPPPGPRPIGNTFTEVSFINKLQRLLCTIKSHDVTGEKAKLKCAIAELSLMVEKTLSYFDKAKRVGNDQIASRFYSLSKATRAVERFAEELL